MKRYIFVFTFLFFGFLFMQQGGFILFFNNTVCRDTSLHIVDTISLHKPQLLTDTKNIFPASNAYCLSCHQGIKPIRDNSTQMMKEIYKKGKKAGDPNGCVICHGGNPNAKIASLAHSGTLSYFKSHKGPKEFYPAPGSPWINKNTCGICHKEQVETQMNSLMMTEQGKIHGTLYSFGGLEAYQHNQANYAVSNPNDPHKRLGTTAYQKYMQKLQKLNPQVYPNKNKLLPKAPTIEEVTKNPTLSAYTYLRQECLRCHTGSKGRQKRGDYRGIGCSSCHIPYSNDGFYEGDDKSISKKSGHLLVHQIQSSRNAIVHVRNISYTGVPVETCSTCHNRGKRIGVSYEGLMETSYEPTYAEDGSTQAKLHTKHYLHLQSDVHMKKGMLCQDCHTTRDIHGDGFLSGATLAPVEIECQDCHGTTKRYPWELPLGYGDEFTEHPAEGKARGTTKKIPDYLRKGTIYPAGEGYLLTARGNPLKNVVKKGKNIIVHLAGGKDIELKPLKSLKENNKISKVGLVAMDEIRLHNDRLECYTCHDTWAPQCYGCHVKVDYSKGQKNRDWLAMATAQDIHGTTAGMRYTDKRNFLIPGKVTETRSYLRWENPPLVQNGEGRISPAMPGCQVVITVIGKDGKALLQNHVFQMPDYKHPNSSKKLPGIVMASVHSHTVQKEARSCESCHANPKAMGYGIAEGKLYGNMSKDWIVDLKTADGKIIPHKYTIQKPKIENFNSDWSRFIDEKGNALQTIDNHWNIAGALNKNILDKLDRRGVCLSCHQAIPNKDLAISLLSHVSKYAGIKIDKTEHSSILHKIVLLGAWLQIGIPLFFLLIIVIVRKRYKFKK